MLLSWATYFPATRPILIQADCRTVYWRPLVSIRFGWLARWPSRHDVIDLVRVDRLVFDQRIGHGVQLVEIFSQ